MKKKMMMMRKMMMMKKNDKKKKMMKMRREVENGRVKDYMKTLHNSNRVNSIVYKSVIIFSFVLLFSLHQPCGLCWLLWMPCYYYLDYESNWNI